MASGSGTDPGDHSQEPAHGNGQREDSSAATAPSDAAPSAAAAQGGADAGSSPSPPPAAPVGRPRAPAVGVVDLKGKRPADTPSPAPSAPSSAGSSPSNPFPDSALPFETGTSSSAAEAGTSSSAPVDYNELFQQLLRDANAEAATPSSAPVECQELLAQLIREAREEEEKKKPEEEQVKSSQPKKKKKGLWRKLKNLFTRKKKVDTEGRQIYPQHVARQTIPINEAGNRYLVTENKPIRVDLDAYSRIRPVLGDGECFYRSFIFSYLEQVLDRQDTHEEDRILDTIERVSTEHTNLGWTSEFCRSCVEFTKLMMKVMEWKRQGRQNNIASTNRKEKLLEFFSTYDTTNDIFVFLRLVVAIQICSHHQYRELITYLSENCNLKDWCFKHVTPSRPGVVSVTLLYTGNHYDIIYPGAPSSEERKRRRAENAPNSIRAIKRALKPFEEKILQIRGLTDIENAHAMRKQELSILDERENTVTTVHQNFWSKAIGNSPTLKPHFLGADIQMIGEITKLTVTEASNLIKVQIHVGENDYFHNKCLSKTFQLNASCQTIGTKVLWKPNMDPKLWLNNVSFFNWFEKTLPYYEDKVAQDIVSIYWNPLEGVETDDEDWMYPSEDDEEWVQGPRTGNGA